MTTIKKTQIYSTTDYSGFKFIQGNRDIIKGHLVRLTAAIAKKNLLPHFPILVNKDFEIIDGQHRFLVAKRNNLEIFYTMSDDAGLIEAQIVNTTQRAWTLTDFIQSFINQGQPEYVRLDNFMIETGFSVSMVINILTKAKHGRDMTRMRKAIKDGTFEPKNWDYALDYVKKLEEVRPYYVLKVIERQREFLFALNIMFGLVDWEKFLEKLAQAKPRLELQLNLKGYLRQLEDIYNYKNPWAGKRFETKRVAQAAV